MRLVLNNPMLASSSLVLFAILHHLPQAGSRAFLLFFLLGTQLKQKSLLSLGFLQVSAFCDTGLLGPFVPSFVLIF